MTCSSAPTEAKKSPDGEKATPIAAPWEMKWVDKVEQGDYWIASSAARQALGLRAQSLLYMKSSCLKPQSSLSSCTNHVKSGNTYLVAMKCVERSSFHQIKYLLGYKMRVAVSISILSPSLLGDHQPWVCCHWLLTGGSCQLGGSTLSLQPLSEL